MTSFVCPPLWQSPDFLAFQKRSLTLASLLKPKMLLFIQQ